VLIIINSAISSSPRGATRAQREISIDRSNDRTQVSERELAWVRFGRELKERAFSTHSRCYRPSEEEAEPSWLEQNRATPNRGRRGEPLRESSLRRSRIRILQSRAEIGDSGFVSLPRVPEQFTNGVCTFTSPSRRRRILRRCHPLTSTGKTAMGKYQLGPRGLRR